MCSRHWRFRPPSPGHSCSPLRKRAAGIHLFGNSSTGKTTLLKLAASVWGESGLVHSWRATANGLEGVANRTSDVVLILDELGQLDSRDAATSLYMLASGVGKIRMNRNATLQDIKTWRAFMLSSGEMTVETKITQMRGAKAYTGATLRLLNVAADRGLGFGAFDSAGSTGDVPRLVKAFAGRRGVPMASPGRNSSKSCLLAGEASEGDPERNRPLRQAETSSIGRKRPGRARGETFRADRDRG